MIAVVDAAAALLLLLLFLLLLLILLLIIHQLFQFLSQLKDHVQQDRL